MQLRLHIRVAEIFALLHVEADRAQHPGDGMSVVRRVRQDIRVDVRSIADHQGHARAW